MEVHMSRLLRNSVSLSALAVAIGALACRDTTKPRELSNAGITVPSYTAAVDFTPMVVGRGNLGTFHIQSKAGTYDAELKSHDNTDIVVVRLELGVVSTGLGLNVKRAEVAASNDHGRKVHCGRVARHSDSRVRKLSRFRRVSAGERSDSDGER